MMMDDAVRREVAITNSQGLHARPAAAVVEAMKSYDSSMWIEIGEKKADARSVMALLALGGTTGDLAHIVAEGEDAAEAVASIVSILIAEEES